MEMKFTNNKKVPMNMNLKKKNSNLILIKTKYSKLGQVLHKIKE